MSVPYNISFYDLIQYPLFKMAAKQNDKELMKKIFWEAGIDTTKEFELVEVLHRPITRKEPWFGLRVHGKERLDAEWLASGAASEDAMYHSVDKDMLDELIALDPHKAKRKAEWAADRELSIKLDLDIMN